MHVSTLIQVALARTEHSTVHANQNSPVNKVRWVGRAQFIQRQLEGHGNECTIWCGLILLVFSSYFSSPGPCFQRCQRPVFQERASWLSNFLRRQTMKGEWVIPPFAGRVVTVSTSYWNCRWGGQRRRGRAIQQRILTGESMARTCSLFSFSWYLPVNGSELDARCDGQPLHDGESQSIKCKDAHRHSRH